MIRFAQNHFLPKDNFGEMTYFGLIVVTVGTYVCRYLLFLALNYGPLGFLAIFCLPLIGIPIVGGLTFIGISLYYLWKSKNPVPLIAFFPLFALAIYFLPLAPMPPSAEERHFKEHRTDYDHMINLAKQGQLNASNAQWEAKIAKRNPLVVTFSPTGFYGVIAYAEKEQDLRGTSGCGADGRIYRQIDEHWWLCYREWN